MEPAIQIRPARGEDISRIDTLIADSIGLWKPHYSPVQIESSLTHLFHVDPQLIADAAYYVAARYDELLGCCGWSPDLLLGEHAEWERGFEHAQIRALFVHPNWLRRGIGGRLLRTCEAAATEAGYPQMGAVATLSGVPFYRHHGYAEVEQRALRLPDGELFPMAHMRKNLTRAMHTESLLCI